LRWQQLRNAPTAPAMPQRTTHPYPLQIGQCPRRLPTGAGWASVEIAWGARERRTKGRTKNCVNEGTLPVKTASGGGKPGHTHFPLHRPRGPQPRMSAPPLHTGECPGSVKAGICSCKRSATCGASAETVGGGSRPTRNTETLAQSPTFTQLRRCGVACTLRKSTHNDTCHVISFSITCLSSVRTKDDKKTRDYSSFGCVFTNRSPEFRTITSAINMTNWPFPRRSPRAQLGHDD
jgi:hypothetical protein